LNALALRQQVVEHRWKSTVSALWYRLNTKLWKSSASPRRPPAARAGTGRRRAPRAAPPCPRSGADAAAVVPMALTPLRPLAGAVERDVRRQDEASWG